MVLGNLWDGRFGTWGLHLREETPALGQGDDLSQPGAGFGGLDPNVNLNESFDLMWAKKFGGTSLGLRLNRSHFENIGENIFGAGVTTNLKFDPVGAALNDENFARNIMGFGGGVGFEMNPNSSIELGVLYQNRSFENRSEPPVASYEDDGGTTYLFAGRMMWQWQPNVVVVPVVKYYSMDLSVKTIAGATTNTWENTFNGWQAGVAGNWTLGQNDLFVLGVTFAQNKLEQQLDFTGLAPDTAEITETLMPQVFAALETHVNPWLTLRFGAQKGAFHKLKIKSLEVGDEQIEVTGASFLMNLGAGVKLGTLQFDAVLANDIYQNLGYLTSGNSTPGGLFPKVTATYSF
jgi:hypothetical protein